MFRLNWKASSHPKSKSVEARNWSSNYHHHSFGRNENTFIKYLKFPLKYQNFEFINLF